MDTLHTMRPIKVLTWINVLSILMLRMDMMVRMHAWSSMRNQTQPHSGSCGQDQFFQFPKVPMRISKNAVPVQKSDRTRLASRAPLSTALLNLRRGRNSAHYAPWHLLERLSHWGVGLSTWRKRSKLRYNQKKKKKKKGKVSNNWQSLYRVSNFSFVSPERESAELGISTSIKVIPFVIKKTSGQTKESHSLKYYLPLTHQLISPVMSSPTCDQW